MFYPFLLSDMDFFFSFFYTNNLLQEDLLELQDESLASTMRMQQQRALEFWEKNWVFISYLFY
jgi:hypothetical protein